MKRRITSTLLACFLLACLGTAAATQDPTNLGEQLSTLRAALDSASFGLEDKKSRRQAFERLIAQAEQLASAFPREADARAWQGIVLSAYAGEVGGLSAMKYAKEARSTLLQAEKLGPGSFDSGVYASLGALYAKVPGGLLGFGDDEVAAFYFAKALETDPDNLDAAYFYGEFLIDQGRYGEAANVLQRALSAPADPTRPLFESGRREQIRVLLGTARDKIG